MLLEESNASTVLTWVRPDLDKHLSQIRTQIEAIADSSQVGDGIDDTVENLTQLQYTFETLVLQGASKLVGEMNTLCEKLRSGHVRDNGKAFAALMDAIVVVPSYLDRLQAGHHDLPILLLPVINDLRAAYNANIVSEATLFTPDLDVEIPELTREPQASAEQIDGQDDESAQDFLERMKRQYETSLLQWLQKQDDTDLLLPIFKVCETLSQRLEGLQAKRLWWIASIVVSGLRDGVTDNDVQLRRLFARLHLTIKTLAEKGEELLDLEAVDAISQALLFHIAQAESGNANVDLLRLRFNLNELVPDRGVLMRARGAITGRNRELYLSLGTAVRDELSMVKDALDLELRTGKVEPERRQQSHDALLRLKDTLKMMGLGDSAESIAGLMPAFVASAPGQEGEDSDTDPDLNGTSNEKLLMALAEKLIQVESVLDEQIATLGEPLLSEQGSGYIELPAHEQIRIRSHLLNEAVISLHHVEDAVRRHFDGATDADYLSGLEQVAGAMELLGESDTATLALKLRNALDNLLRVAKQESQIDPEKLENVTDAVAAFELYLAACRDQQSNRDRFLAIIKDRLEQLPIGEMGVVVNEQDATDAAKKQQDEDQATAPESLDAELLSVFLEEYETVKDMLDQQIPQWSEKPDSSELMADIRRGFHTLKGSGRMVGAYELGDFAWHVEELINNLLDNNIESFDDVTTLVTLANAALPAMQQRLLLKPADLEANGILAISNLADDIGNGKSPNWSALDQHLPVELLSLIPGYESAEPLDGIDTVTKDEAGLDAELEAETELETEVEAGVEAEAEVESEAEAEVEAEVEAETGTEVEAEAEAEVEAETGTEVEAEAEAETEAEAGVETVEEAAAELTAEAGAEADVEEDQDTEAETELEAEAEDLVADDETEGLVTEAETESEADAATQELEAETEAEVEAEGAEKGEQPSDEILNDLICSEFSGNLETLHALMEDVSKNRNTVSEEQHIIAAHTIAGTAALNPLSREVEVAKALENFLTAQRNGQKAFTDTAMWTLATSLAHLNTCLAIHQGDIEAELVEDEQSQIDQLHELTDEYEAVVVQTDEPEVTELPEDVEPPVVIELPADSSTSEETEETGESTEETGKTSEETEATTDQDADIDGQPTDTQESEEESAEIDHVDAEILALFLQEASEVLETCDSLLNSWRDNLPNLSIVQNLQREIHTFKGGARMSGVSSMGDLSHAMETLLEQIAGKLLPPSVTAIEALEQGCDRLTDFVEEAGRGQIPQIGSALKIFEEQAQAIVAEHSLPEEETDTTEEMAGEAIDDKDLSESEDTDPDSDARAVLTTADTPVESKKTRKAKARAKAAKDKARQDSAQKAASKDAASEKDEAKPDSAQETKAVEVITEIEATPIETMELPENVPESSAMEEGGDTSGAQQIRVNADLLDSLVNSAGEISIFRSRMEQQVTQQRETLKEFDETVSRLREQFRKLEIETETQIRSRYQQETNNSSEEFDPLELDRFSSMQQLSRSLSESVSDLLNLQELLDESSRKSEALLVQQSRVSTELQEGLMQTRMVHFATIAPRLRRLVRSAASETGKKALLHLRMTDGGDQLDRNVLERITAPLEHLLRNAIAHGIEEPNDRKKANKPADGALNVTVSSEATEFVVRVEDDGAGLDRDAIRQRAIDTGLIDKNASLQPQQLNQFILQSGFTTSKTVTGLAGRGVGMDVVNSEIKQIGGSIEIDSVPGKGSRFTIRIPFTLAVMQAIGVVAGEHRYLIPLASVAGVARMVPEDYRKLLESESPVYEFAGDKFSVLEIEPLLGEPSTPLGDDTVSILLIKAGEQRAAFRVPELLGHREIVIKPVGPQISSVPGILGGTITGDGQVVVIIDSGPLIRQALIAGASPVVPLASGDTRRKQLLAMVVDDSITMRKVTSRVLEGRDFEVITARDGVDATEQMQERIPDLLLLDVEMPRMDGYQVAEYVRADARLRHVPIIMITSRGGEKHRERGKRAGADGYITKPYKEADLIDEVQQLLRSKER